MLAPPPTTAVGIAFRTLPSTCRTRPSAHDGHDQLAPWSVAVDAQKPQVTYRSGGGRLAPEASGDLPHLPFTSWCTLRLPQLCLTPRMHRLTRVEGSGLRIPHEGTRTRST